MSKRRHIKAPVVLQMEALECGAAALGMVLSYHGRYVPLEQLREDCCISRDGSLVKYILRAAKMYGLEGEVKRYTLDEIKSLPLPCILHWHGDHFVVFCGFKGNKAVINDPSGGHRELSMDEFTSSVSGVTMTFIKADDFKKGGKPASVLEFAKKRLHGALPTFIFILIGGLITTLLGIVNPLFVRIFVDYILDGYAINWLPGLLFAMLVIAVAGFIAAYINSRHIYSLEANFAVSSNTSFVWHILRLPIRFFHQRRVADIMTRRTCNESIAYSLIQELAPLLLHLITLVFYVIVMLNYSLLLTIIGVSAMLLSLLLTNYIVYKRMGISRLLTREKAKLITETYTCAEMIETIKCSGAESGFFRRWAGYQASANALDNRYIFFDRLLTAIPGFLTSLCDIVVLMLGVMLIINKQFTVGTLLAFQGFLNSSSVPLADLVSAGNNFSDMKISMERVEDCMNYSPDVSDDYETQDINGRLLGRISIKNVNFGYVKLEEPLIRDFSLEVYPGQSIAIAGSSGSGKSTLTYLVSGLYEPWSGEILFDGKPHSAIDRTLFTSSVGVVDQSIMLFSGTADDNIRMWDASKQESSVIRGAMDAQLHDDIMERENGYKSYITEDGGNLSGGQRQRMEIARVLAGEPSILILDEATSSLDAETEALVIEAINKRNVTCLIVAHRLSTIRSCDKIIVLKNGIAVEQGTHEELMSLNGEYSELVRSN